MPEDELPEYRMVAAHLDRIEDDLTHWGEPYRKNVQRLNEITTRKTASLNYVEFVGPAVSLMKKVFGKPHYEEVAAMIAVLFDKDVGGEAVRTAARNRAAKVKAVYSRAQIIDE